MEDRNSPVAMVKGVGKQQQQPSRWVEHNINTTIVINLIHMNMLCS